MCGIDMRVCVYTFNIDYDECKDTHVYGGLHVKSCTCQAKGPGVGYRAAPSVAQTMRLELV